MRKPFARATETMEQFGIPGRQPPRHIEIGEGSPVSYDTDAFSGVRHWRQTSFATNGPGLTALQRYAAGRPKSLT